MNRSFSSSNASLEQHDAAGGTVTVEQEEAAIDGSRASTPRRIDRIGVMPEPAAKPDIDTCLIRRP